MDLKSLKLTAGQMRANELVHNGGWYNKDGEKIGWGDLSATDLGRIKTSLKDDEVFVILSEQDSFWNFISWKDGVGHITNQEQYPGKYYVCERAIYVIIPGKIYNRSRYDKGVIVFDHHGVSVEVECVASWEGIL